MPSIIETDGTESLGTRSALLEAGRALFAERGFDGASVRAITAQAGANLGAITYHFGTKEAFYDEVIETTISPLAEAVLSAARTDGSPLDRAEFVVRAYFGHLSAHPELPRLMLQGIVASGMPPASALRHVQRVLAEIVQIVNAGQQDGSMRKGNPVVMGMGIISQSIHLVTMRKPLLALARIDLSDTHAREQLADELVRFVRAGLVAYAGVLSEGEGQGKAKR